MSTKLPLRAGTAGSAVWAGFVGSMLILLGSLGVGWLAGSSPLIRTPLLIVARTTPAAVIICTLLLCAGAVLMFRSWLRLYQLMKPFTAAAQPLLIKALALWTAPMMVALPLFSRDSYAYIGQGRLMEQGLDPYTNGISALNNYFILGPDTMWTEAPTPYGPLWLWMEHFAVWMAQGSTEMALVPFRLSSLLGVILLAVYVPKLAARHGFNPQFALWVAVLNPVTLLNFIASVHNDSLMMGLVAAGVYFATKKHPLWIIWGILLVTASVAIKPITLIALPFIGLLWAGAAAGWVRKFAIWGATLAISMATMAAMGAVNGLGFGWLAALQTPGTVWHWYAPIGMGSVSLGSLVDVLGGNGNAVADTIQTIAQIASILIVIVLALMKIRVAPSPAAGTDLAAGTELPLESRYSHIVLRRMAWAFAAVVLLAPMIQPWYGVWLLAFFAMTGIKEGKPLLLVMYLTAFFTGIALTDQLSVFQWIPVDLVRFIAIAASLAGLVYVIVVDSKTRLIFRPRATAAVSAASS